MKVPISCAWTGLLAILMVEGTFAQVGLKEMPSGKWWVDRRIIQELKLSPDQQAKIEALWRGNQRTLIDQRADFERRQLDLADLLAKDLVDEEAALKAFDGVAAARRNLERTTFLMRLQIKNLLAAEQQQKLETIAQRLRVQKAKGNAPGSNPTTPQAKKSGH
ncbi:MAG: hypothetical protein ABSH28_06330 [Acidobacteriota bacterium]|jgi:Spy/CpxP family protein refolding chaperone